MKYNFFHNRLLLGSLASILVFSGVTSQRTPAPEKPNENLVAYRAKVEQAVEHAVHNVGEAEKRFLQRIQGLENNREHDRLISRCANDAGDLYKSNRELTTLIGLVARDRISGSHDAEQRIERRINNTIQPWVTTHAREVNGAMAQLHRELREAMEAFSNELDVLQLELHAMDPVASAGLTDMDYRGSLNELGSFAGIQIALLPVDVHGLVKMKLLKSLPPHIVRVSSTLFKKQIAMGATAAGAAAIDGPLPFGDLIGAVILVGGTVYTLREWSRLQSKFQQEVTAQVRNGLREARRDSLATARGQGAAMVRLANGGIREMLENALSPSLIEQGL